jgi:hypothetical protein
MGFIIKCYHSDKRKKQSVLRIKLCHYFKNLTELRCQGKDRLYHSKDYTLKSPTDCSHEEDIRGAFTF